MKLKLKCYEVTCHKESATVRLTTAQKDEPDLKEFGANLLLHNIDPQTALETYVPGNDYCVEITDAPVARYDVMTDAPSAG